MEELIVELRLFLELLDHEYLTSTVREKKAVLTDILLRVQSAEGAAPALAWLTCLQAFFSPTCSNTRPWCGDLRVHLVIRWSLRALPCAVLGQSPCTER